MRLASALAALGTLAPLVVAAGASGAAPEPIAVMQGLDKITARVSRFDTPLAKPVTFGTLAIVVRDCERSAPEEQPENAAFVEIYETPPGEKTKRLFSGWMFSSSPALSGLEHPVYDVTLLGCKASSVAAPAPLPSPAPKPGGKPQR